ncbi:MAG TPA: hypothetical protein VF060_12770 [Trebonia sp.]
MSFAIGVTCRRTTTAISAYAADIDVRARAEAARTTGQRMARDAVALLQADPFG